MLRPVAPHVGAWIETSASLNKANRRWQSHPMWVRGLKRALFRDVAT